MFIPQNKSLLRESTISYAAFVLPSECILFVCFNSKKFFFSPPAYVYLYSWVLRLDSHHLTLMFEFCSVPEDEFGCRVFAINRPFLDCYTYTTITRIMNECVKENAVCILAVQMRDLLYY